MTSKVPKVKLNPMLEQIRGRIGGLVIKRYGDKLVLSRLPNFEGVTPSAAQAVGRERFRQATLYAKTVMADPAARAIYEEVARAQRRATFRLAVADFCHAPRVEQVDVAGYTGQVGDPIVIRATDDFEVVGVHVALSGGDGALIEAGAARQTPGQREGWVYTATAAVPSGTRVHIRVTATDRPGGTGMAETDKPV